MTLVSRGNVWKHYHGEKPVFASLDEEAAFFGMLGHTDEVINPACSLYKWTLDEILKAMQEGTVDGLQVDRGLFGMSQDLHHRAIKFRDPELGKRVREATLKGFADRLENKQ